MIYLNISKGRRNIPLLISLALITALSVIGPWSSYSVSIFSQNQRLEGLLQKYDMIKDGTIVKSEKEVSDIDKKEISGILRYFSNVHSFQDVKYLPKDFTMIRMKHVFGFEAFEYGYIEGKRYFAYYSNLHDSPIDIAGYSYMFVVNNSTSGNRFGNGYDIKFNGLTYEIIISYDDKEVYKTSLRDFIKQIHTKHSMSNDYNIAANEMTFVDETENIKLKIVFSQINGYEDEANGEIVWESMNFHLLVSNK